MNLISYIIGKGKQPGVLNELKRCTDFKYEVVIVIYKV